MLMITVKNVSSVDHLEIYDIRVFVDITPSAFNIANVSRGLSGVHIWMLAFSNLSVRMS